MTIPSIRQNRVSTRPVAGMEVTGQMAPVIMASGICMEVLLDERFKGWGLRFSVRISSEYARNTEGCRLNYVYKIFS